jgi:tRNA pseudouridine32 synthase/23S rRNA pseudouridine746 synthase
MQAGLVRDEHGAPLAPDAPYQPHGWLLYWRDPGPEPEDAPAITLLQRDADWVAVDKPHGLPTVPSGPYLQQTALVQLQRLLGEDDWSPVHRLDQDTAGVLLLARGAMLAKLNAAFRQHQVDKCYEAIAPWRANLPWPLTRTSRLGAGAHFLLRAEVPGQPNASTTITPLEVRGALARYQLQPRTGQRHQLRVHMAALGLPIVGDRCYPRLLPPGLSDAANPLRLLARSQKWCDPASGILHDVHSRITLAWPDAAQAPVTPA